MNRVSRIFPILVIASFLAGLLTAYGAWGRGAASAQILPPAAAQPAREASTSVPFDLEGLMAQVNPPDGHPLGVHYGDLGPRLIAAGVIDYDAFAALYERAGMPLTAPQQDALKRGSDEPIVIDPGNSSYLLNFFWAVGLANQNPILTAGPMVAYSQGQIERFASTGGWSLANRPIAEIYASLPLITLTSAQQARLEEVASAVYRPCCDNPTHFPDCNHGMAMLGLLELMASENATAAQMFEAAKYVNAYWFPNQSIETALFLKTARNIDFQAADGRLLTGKALASGSGFAAMHQDLQARGLLPQLQGGSGSCAN